MANANEDDVTVRPIRRDDLSAFWAMRLEALAAHPSAFGSDHAEHATMHDWPVQRVEDSVAGAKGHIVVADAPGGLVACAGAVRDQGAKVQHAAIVWGVYVRPPYRGHRLTERMVLALHAWCAAEGVRLMRLEVTTTNAAAIRSYQRCGFTGCGVQPEAIRVGDAYHDELLMWRRV